MIDQAAVQAEIFNRVQVSFPEFDFLEIIGIPEGLAGPAEGNSLPQVGTGGHAVRFLVFHCADETFAGRHFVHDVKLRPFVHLVFSRIYGLLY